MNGTDADETINGPLTTSSGQQINTFNGSDVIDGGDGEDTLFAQFPGQGAGFGETFIRSNVDNVENFQLQNNFTAAGGLTFDWDLAENSLGGTHELISTTGTALYQNVPQAPDAVTLQNLSNNASLTERIESGVLAQDDGTSLDLTTTDVFPAAGTGAATIDIASESNTTVRFSEVNLTSNGTANRFSTFNLLTTDAATSNSDEDEVLGVSGPGDLIVTAVSDADTKKGSDSFLTPL